MSEILTVNGSEYSVKKLLGKGKGGYSYLVTDGKNEYVLKKIHHEPCDYYTFGNKLESELRDYGILRGAGIPLPRLIDVDTAQEHILKEYIDGETVSDLLSAGKYDRSWSEQVREMCAKLYPGNLNIDYFPANFVLREGKLFYIDYECNQYMEEWDFEHWGEKYWHPVRFRNYSESDYDAVCGFLAELNRSNDLHINWNWARFEWMYEHPETDRSLIGSIGLWKCGERVVGAAIYDMYFGEAFCGALREYEHLFPEILEYASEKLCDESGIAVAICDENPAEIEAANKVGFSAFDQHETIMMIGLDHEYPAELPDGMKFAELDPAADAYDFQWLLWQGFDHGEDKAEFEKQEKIVPQKRRHLDPHLSLAAVNHNGEKVAYCCLWYDKNTDYAYVEPVCTVPSYRGRGIAKALIYEALGRVRKLGAKRAYVISDMDFYSKLGFQRHRHFTFYRKRRT